MSSAIQHQHDRNDYLTREIATLDKQIEEINGSTRRSAGCSRAWKSSRRCSAAVRDRPRLRRARAGAAGGRVPYIREAVGHALRAARIAQSSTRVSSFMRNIDASQWLADPTLQIVETRAKDSAGGASFTLFANQRRQASAEDDPAATPTGKAKKKAAAK